MSIFLRRIGTSSAFSRNATGKRAAAKGVETRRERGELKEAAAKAVVTKQAWPSHHDMKVTALKSPPRSFESYHSW